MVFKFIPPYALLYITLNLIHSKYFLRINYPNMAGIFSAEWYPFQRTLLERAAPFPTWFLPWTAPYGKACPSENLLMSCPVTTPEPASNIAGVRTVFPVVIPISGKTLAACRANIFVYSFQLQTTRVRLVPADAAITATEFPLLHLRALNDHLSTAQAYIRRHFRKGVPLRRFTTKAMAPAVSLDTIFRQPDCIGNGSVAVSLMPETCDFSSLFVRHIDLQSEGLTFTTHWRQNAKVVRFFQKI